MTAAQGVFERHGKFPSVQGIGELARRESARRVISYLTAKGLLTEQVGWDYLTEPQREEWVTALSTVLLEAEREVRKAAYEELLAYEDLAIGLWCPRCKAQEGTKCWDMRKPRQRVHTKHPHAERMAELEEEMK